MKQKPKIIVIAGPSASGKSKLAVKIAKRYNGEIISADSRCVYKYIDIASAKPTFEEMDGIKHYLINICEVTEEYSVGRFIKDADKFIQLLNHNNKIPIVTGGTGLYFRALRGTFDIPEVLADIDFRKKAETIDNNILYNELKEKNPNIANKIHPNNKVKIIRALEIVNSGVELKSKECPYDILWIGLNAKNRKFLYNRADLRVDDMFNYGLLREAVSLFEQYGENSILKNTIGIKELYNVIYQNEDIDLAKENIKKNTRHYIKRQISWFNSEKEINWIFIDEDDLYSKSSSLIDKFLTN